MVFLDGKTDYRVVLTDYRALLTDCTALLTQHRALLQSIAQYLTHQVLFWFLDGKTIKRKELTK